MRRSSARESRCSPWWACPVMRDVQETTSGLGISSNSSRAYRGSPLRSARCTKEVARIAEAERPSLRSTVWSGPTWGAERRAAAAFRAEARDVASHAVVGLCHEAYRGDMPAGCSRVILEVEDLLARTKEDRKVGFQRGRWTPVVQSAHLQSVRQFEFSAHTECFLFIQR